MTLWISERLTKSNDDFVYTRLGSAAKLDGRSYRVHIPLISMYSN